MARHLYHIPAGADFLKVLVKGLQARWNSEKLATGVIMLPTRRACTALREAFMQDTGAREARLLPRITTLSATDEDALLLLGDDALAERYLALPPPMPPLRRRMLLAGLIRQKAATVVSAQQAFLLAGELASLLDNVQREGCDLGGLERLVEGQELAAHWEKTVAFLSVLREEWPRLLAREGRMDAVARGLAIKQLQLEHWRRDPPAYPVVAAGSTGSHPVTAEMLKAISSFAEGAVVLAGLDTVLDEQGWKDIGPTHPDYLHKRLLLRMECGREQVGPWVEEELPCPRSVFLSEVMRPAETTASWRFLKADNAPWQGLTLMVAAREQQEAMLAAMLMRKYGAEDGLRVMLVTPDRLMAARTAAILRRWGLAVDDSSGQPLAARQTGAFFLRLLPLMQTQLLPSEFLDVLKHPFASAGMGRAECLFLARQIETGFFAKQPRGRGLENWRLAATEGSRERGLFEHVQRLLPTDAEQKDFSSLLQAHVRLAESLGQKEVLWQGAEGQDMAAFIEEFSFACVGQTGHVDDYAALFTAALEAQVSRAHYGQHPRLSIFGLQEARLMTADVMILAGLNEGVWPEERRHDAFLSPSMRVAFGLPHADQPVGQTAHDFLQLASQRQVILLRTARMGDAPAIPSRWVMRLDAILRMLGKENELCPPLPWQEWAQAYDIAALQEPCAPPAISLPQGVWPTQFSATDVEMLLQDPYAYYAKKILRLKPLNDADGSWGGRERGTALHRALQEVCEAFPAAWPEEAEERLFELFGACMRALGAHEEDMALSSPRLALLAQAFWQYEKVRREKMAAFVCEVEGSMTLSCGGQKLMVTAKADRLELLKNGQLAVVDYKTGQLPKTGAFQAGLKPQLLIEALIAAAGGFPGMKARETAEYLYLRLSEGMELLEPKSMDVPQATLMDVHAQGLTSFLAAMLSDGAVLHAAPRPFLLAPHPDYARLARVAEWSKGALAQEEA